MGCVSVKFVKTQTSLVGFQVTTSMNQFTVCSLMKWDLMRSASASITGQQGEWLLSSRYRPFPECWLVYRKTNPFFFLWFFSIFKCADYLCRSYFQIRSVVKLMNWAWSCLLHKLLVFPHSLAHSPPLLCNQQISITHVPPSCADCIRAPWMHSVQFVHKSAGLNLSLGAGL